MLLSLVVLTCISLVQGQSPCQPPGECVPVIECPSITAILNKKPPSPQEIADVRKTFCGFGSTAKVCCPNMCQTQAGERGQCLNIYSCQHLLQLLGPPLLPANAQIIRDARCNGPTANSVCCGPPPKTCPDTSQPPDPTSKCCGKEAFTGNRITGGNATALDQYPWLALIEYQVQNKIEFRCGGALISSKYVLTAAHCVTGSGLQDGSPVNVRLGEYDTTTPVDCVLSEGGGRDCNNPPVTIPIDAMIPHPQYDPKEKRSRRNDIALLRLRSNAPYTEFIRPVCLPTFDLSTRTDINVEDLKLFAAGWGATDALHSSSNVKLHVDLPYKTAQQCQEVYEGIPRQAFQLWNKQICAGGDKDKDSCRGDSGGPLVYENLERFEIVGVISFGPDPCGEEGTPGVYTKVYDYNDWIRSTIKP